MSLTDIVAKYLKALFCMSLVFMSLQAFAEDKEQIPSQQPQEVEAINNDENDLPASDPNLEDFDSAASSSVESIEGTVQNMNQILEKVGPSRFPTSD